MEHSAEQCTDTRGWNNGLSPAKKAAIIFLNYITFFFSASLVCILVLPWAPIGIRVLAAVFTLYLAPPIAARIVLRIAPIQRGIIESTSADFVKWWALMNFQVLFVRLPFLEEFLRIIPGLYGSWLRLWGAKVGRLTYWAPGLTILDRSFVDIGDDVVFGAGVRLNPHVLFKNDQGLQVLALDYIHIGDRTIIGGYSLFTAGTVICPDQTTRAMLSLPPFTKWRDGKRLKDNADTIAAN